LLFKKIQINKNHVKLKGRRMIAFKFKNLGLIDAGILNEATLGIQVCVKILEDNTGRAGAYPSP